MNTQRAFTGLAGSPLATITEPTKKRGRPRQFANATERKRANRAKKKKQEAIDNIDSMDRGLSMPQGRQIVFGGFDDDHLGKIAARNGALIGQRIVGRPDGRRVVQPGYGPDPIREKSKETDSTFAARIRFPINWQLSPSEKDLCVKGMLQECISSPVSSTDTNWDADTKEYPILPATHRCLICGSAFDWTSEARTHLLEKHKRDVNRVIRQHQPKQTDSPSKELRDRLKTAVPN